MMSENTASISHDVDLDSQVASVQRLPSVGGGRGVFATQDIGPGALILQDTPIVAMPTDVEPGENAHARLARAVLQSPDRATLLAKLAPLHPVHLSHLLPDAVLRLAMDCAADMDRLLLHAGAAAQPGADEAAQAPLTREGVLCLLLKIRFNAHPSGCYVQSEMFNHGCCPNAVKLMVGPGVSHIRAVRPINKGHEITISYLDPPFQSRARRCWMLETQHLFRPEPGGVFDFPPQMEAWADGCAAGAAEREQELEAIEAALDAAELTVRHACAALDRACQRAAKATRRARRPASAGPGPEAAQVITAQRPVVRHLSAACELQRRAAQSLHPRHLVLARAHELIIELSSALLQAWPAWPQPPMRARRREQAPVGAAAQGDEPQPGAGAGAGTDKGLPEDDGVALFLPTNLDMRVSVPAPAGQTQPEQQAARAGGAAQGPDVVDVALLLLRCGLELRDTQELYAGPAHLDAARTLQDLYRCLDFCLGAGPKRLYVAFPGRFGSFAAASRESHALKTEHQRIAALYA